MFLPKQVNEKYKIWRREVNALPMIQTWRWSVESQTTFKLTFLTVFREFLHSFLRSCQTTRPLIITCYRPIYSTAQLKQDTQSSSFLVTIKETDCWYSLTVVEIHAYQICVSNKYTGSSHYIVMRTQHVLRHLQSPTARNVLSTAHARHSAETHCLLPVRITSQPCSQEYKAKALTIDFWHLQWYFIED